MGGRTAVGAAVLVWLGLLAGAGVGAALVAPLLVGALALVPVAARRGARGATPALLLALVLAALARAGAHRARLELERDAIERGGEWFRIEGRIEEPPQRASGEPLAVLAVERATPALPRGARVRVRLPAGDRSEWGDRVRVLARLEAPLAVRDPGGFDARGAADAARVCATGRAVAVDSLGVAATFGWPRASVARVRRGFERVYASALGDEARALVVPLVTGDRSDMPPGLEADFRTSGLVHLLALSGLHVVWLAALARGLAAALGGGIRARALAGAACALGYLGLAGPLPSLARAALGELVAATAAVRGRALDPLQALALAALMLLARAPGWAHDVGFQLSCAATLGLVTVGAWLDARAGRWRAWVAPFTPTLGAQIGALPVLLGRFHAVSWVAAIANLVAVPVSGLLLAAAWIGALLELAWPGAGHRCLAACEPLARLLRATAALAARVPGALVPSGSEAAIPWLAAAGAAALMAALVPPRTLAARAASTPPARRLAAWAGALALALAVALALTAPPLRPPPGCTWVVVLDVGQGDAIALAHGDAWWLVDAGPRSPRFDAGQNVVLPFLRWAAVRRLAGLVVTHDDNDHRGGVPAVRGGVAVTRVWAPVPRPGAPGPAQRFHARGTARGDTLDPAMPLRVLWPPREGPPLADAVSTPGNQAAVVLEAGAGAGRALLMADADSVVEGALAVAGGVAVLKAGHHGAGSSSGAAFLARMRPVVAAISCGRRNPFGHPSPGALARLAAAGARLDRTDRGGALWYELDARGVRDVEWRRGPPPRVAHAPPGRSAGAARAPSAW